MIGPHELFVADDRLLSLDVNLDIATIVSAADRKVHVLDRKKRRYFESDLDSFESPDNVRTYTPYKYDLVNRHWQKFEDITFNKHLVRGFDLVSSRSKLESNETFRVGRTTGVFKARYWECVDIPVKSQLLLGIEKLYVVPRLKGLPVKLVFSPKRGGPRAVLNTTVLENVTVDRSLFSVPRTYKRAKKISELGDTSKRDAVLEQVTDLLIRD